MDAPFFVPLAILGPGVILTICLHYSEVGKRRAIKKATGGRLSTRVGGMLLEAEPKGLPVNVTLMEAKNNTLYNRAKVTVAVSLIPSADFYVGPAGALSKPLGLLFSGLSPCNLALPWLGDWVIQGEPAKAVETALSKVDSLDGFKKADWRPVHLVCRDNRLEILVETRWAFAPENVKALLDMSADLAFRLMG